MDSNALTSLCAKKSIAVVVVTTLGLPLVKGQFPLTVIVYCEGVCFLNAAVEDAVVDCQGLI